MSYALPAACLLIAVVAAYGCTGPPPAPAAERVSSPPPEDGVVRIAPASLPFIAVEPVNSDDGRAVLTIPARVVFRDGAVSEIGAPLAGRVTRVHVRTGDVVNAADPLVTLDCPEAASGRAAVKTARASLREARAALEREQRMLQQRVGTEREKLRAETKVAELDADLARAEAAATSLGPEDGTAVVVRAPISGTVIGRRATEGMAVQQGGDPLVEIGDPTDLWIVADVFERDLLSLREGARATVEFPSNRGPLAGHIASIGAVVTTGLRTAPVRVTLDADGALLRPGMYGRVRLEAAGVGGLTLPAEAVLLKGTESVVYIEKEPLTFMRRTVTVDRPVDGKVRVLSGLSPEERVVVRGALFLDGAADQMI
jgi:membrane fusion protein, heavy metal efflux system